MLNACKMRPLLKNSIPMECITDFFRDQTTLPFPSNSIFPRRRYAIDFILMMSDILRPSTIELKSRSAPLSLRFTRTPLMLLFKYSISTVLSIGIRLCRLLSWEGFSNILSFITPPLHRKVLNGKLNKTLTDNSSPSYSTPLYYHLPFGMLLYSVY